LLGLSVLAQKNLIGGRFGLVALGLWLLCIGISIFQIPKIVAQFKEDNWHKTESQLPVSSGTLILKLNDYDDKHKGVVRVVDRKIKNSSKWKDCELIGSLFIARRS
jgi:hypothetical protein